jgi:hypothetical protein
MSMTLLQIVQQATGEMGLPVPNAVAGSTLSDVQQQFALTNAVGMELQREFAWEQLQTEYRFTTQFVQATGTTVAGSTILNLSSAPTLDNTWSVTGSGILTDTIVSSAAGSVITLSLAATGSFSGSTYTFTKVKYALPSDYDRMVERTMWDKSRRWQLVGPQTAQQWQWLKSGWISTGPRIRFRIMGGYFQVYPGVAANEVLGYEYHSTNWVTAASGSGKNLFSLDTDTCIFNDRLMIVGLKLKYFQVKGFDTTAFSQEYDAELSRAKAMDSPQDTLSMCPRPLSVLIDATNIPDSGYGGVL